MLRGERITLRAVERGDLPAIHAMRNNADLEGLVYGAPIPHSMAELEAHFDAELATPADQRSDYRFVIDQDGAVVGRSDLFDIDRVSGTARIGVTIDTGHQDAGIGTETVMVLLRYAFRDLGLRRVWCDILADNRRSIRMCEKCGLREEGLLRQHYWYDGAYRDAVVMGILREEWEAR
jgi:RimJ/RimL family protein N-acetyltransferase